MNLFEALILGLVEGLTEYLPVSSTGHLILVNSWLKQSGEIYKVFDIVIQFGAILAVCIFYRDRFKSFLKRDPMREFSGSRAIFFLGLTSLPGLMLGFLLSKIIKEYLFYPVPVGFALVVGGVALLWIEGRKSNYSLQDLNALTWDRALFIGLFQCLALWPGFSRSAATIIGGMLLGLKRGHAAEYSFIAAVPIISAACAYDVMKHWNLLLHTPWEPMALGLLVAFVTALLAIKTFMSWIHYWDLSFFAYYRIILAFIIVWYF